MESYPKHRGRGLLALVSVLVVAGLGNVSPAYAGNSPQGDAAAPWPASFAEYTYADNSSISDLQDESPGYTDLWAGAGGTLPSVYVASDGVNVFFRLRLREDPSSKNGGFQSTVWLLSIGTGGSQAAVVGLYGKDAKTDYVYVGNADGSVTTQIYTTPFTNDGSGTSAGARWSAAPDEGFFVDFQVPIARITAVAPSVTATTPIQLFYGSSQAANLAVINKDFMIGGEVSYVSLKTVTLSGAPPPNSPPVAADDSATTSTNVATTVNVLTNDTDADGDTLSVTAYDATTTAGGTVTCTAGGACDYTPPAGYDGADSFTYTVSDGTDTDTGTVDLTVDPVNDPPVAADDSATIPEDTTTTVNVLANDTDVDGDALSVTAYDATTTAGGTVTCTAGGACDYTPPANYEGADSFTYTVSDGTDTDTGTVSLTVVGANDPPGAVDDPVIAAEDTATTVSVLANDTDPEGDTLAIDFFTQPAHGTVTQSGSDLIYTPDPNYNGPDSFTYRVCDDGAPQQCDSATVSVTVDPGNDPPVANDDSATTAEDTTTTVNVLANDTDVDGDTLSVTAYDATTTAGGTVTCTAGGACDYTPPAGYNGSDSFTYTVSDGTTTDSSTVVVAVGGVNDAPVADDDAVSTPEDTSAVIDPATLLANDIDLDGPGSPAITSVTNGAHGTATIDGLGNVVYTPDPDYHGPDSFTYTVCDQGAPPGCDIATVTMTVSAVNDDPVAKDDTATTNEDEPAVIAVLANDVDVDGDSLTVDAIITAPGHGTAVINGDNTITYTPAPDYFGLDAFEYQIADGNGGFATAWVNFVTVNPVNDPPVAADDSATIPEDTTTTVNVLANDTDVDGDTLSVTAYDATTTAGGTVTCTAGGACDYTPPANYEGADSFTYTVSDPGGFSASATVNVTVEPPNEVPVAGPDVAVVPEDGSVQIDVLANDSDPESTPLAISAVGPADHGSVSIVDAMVLYVPVTDFAGSDAFDYTVCDAGGACSMGAVSVTVTPVYDPPAAAQDTVTVGEAGSVTFDPLANDLNPDGAILSVAITTPPIGGSAVVNPDNTITYVGAQDFSGVDHFEYSVCDGSGGCSSTMVAVTVTAVNDPPVYQGAPVLTVAQGQVPALFEFFEPDGDPYTVTIKAGFLPLGLTLLPDGTWSGTPQGEGAFPLLLEVCDPFGACSEVSLVLSIELLPRTGTDHTGLLALATGLLFAGMALLLGSRRHRVAHHRPEATGR